MDGKPGLCDLPTEILTKIFSHLDFIDLVHMKYLNKRLCMISKEEQQWKKLCQEYWLQQDCPYGRTWEEHFKHWYADMGAYVHVYAHIKKTWDRITSYFKVNCPLIYQTIKDGCTEEELNEFEEHIAFGKLPPDFRCSYRIHNGQRLTSPGLLGTMSIPGHYRSESLLDLDTILVGLRREEEGFQGCIPLTLCLYSGVSQYLAVTDEGGYECNTVFYPCKRDPAKGKKCVDAFISGTTFSEWLTTHANHLDNEDFVLIQDQPFRFTHDPAAEETTDDITVSVATCFLPEMSKINPPKFYHTYRITMSMSPNAKQSEACQLETRHWTITDDNGSEEQVDGPGVVGEYPVMHPGAVFSWISSTSFSTTYGNMKGHFRMRNLVTCERSEVRCPVFHMKCLPYITGEERDAYTERKQQKDF